MARKYTESAVKTVGASALRILQNHVGHVADIIVQTETRVRFGPIAVGVTPSRAHMCLAVKRVGEGNPFRFYVVRLNDSVTVKGPIPEGSDSVSTFPDAPIIGTEWIFMLRRPDGTARTRTYSEIGDLVGGILAKHLEPKSEPMPQA